jgi:hypothetical protein
MMKKLLGRKEKFYFFLKQAHHGRHADRSTGTLAFSTGKIFLFFDNPFLKKYFRLAMALWTEVVRRRSRLSGTGRCRTPGLPCQLAEKFQCSPTHWRRDVAT